AAKRQLSRRGGAPVVLDRRVQELQAVPEPEQDHHGPGDDGDRAPTTLSHLASAVGETPPERAGPASPRTRRHRLAQRPADDLLPRRRRPVGDDQPARGPAPPSPGSAPPSAGAALRTAVYPGRTSGVLLRPPA